MIRVKVDGSQIQSGLNRLVKQIPFALSTALTNVAKNVQAAERANMQQRLDRPKPFTLQGVRMSAARKDTLQAKVFVMDTTSSYLEPYEYGGLNKLNSRALIKPIGMTLDQYGNLPRKAMARLKARKDVFVGEYKGIRGVWQRPFYRPKGTKKGSSRRAGRIPAGANTTGKLKLLVRFTDAHQIAAKNRLHWFDIAGETVKATSRTEVAKALEQALATAK